MSRLAALACLVAFAPVAAAAPRPPSYRSVVLKVAGMVNDERAQSLAGARGLALLDVTWEDTGRYLGSSVGPNISDVTIEVQLEDARGRLETALMPVLRHPNFSDLTGDVKLDSIRLPIGNQTKGGQLEVVTLRELLADPAKYLSDPTRGAIRGGSLLAPRDSHALVSAQAAFLPVPRAGKAMFWPVIFNYQSTKEQPAVLAILVTRQGTSMTIVDNARDSRGGASWGQRLFFNAGGQRAPLTAERRSDVEARGTTMNGESAASLGDDANLMMLIQVPLKVRPRPRKALSLAPAQPMSSAMGAGDGYGSGSGRRSDVESAVLGHGPELGPYVELDGKTIARDPRFPVRVTVQFYQATSNGVVARADVARLAAQIRKVYRRADYVGSLVVPSSLDLERRPTVWDGVSAMPSWVSWGSFAGLMETAAP